MLLDFDSPVASQLIKHIMELVDEKISERTKEYWNYFHTLRTDTHDIIKRLNKELDEKSKHCDWVSNNLKKLQNMQAQLEGAINDLIDKVEFSIENENVLSKLQDLENEFHKKSIKLIKESKK